VQFRNIIIATGLIAVSMISNPSMNTFAAAQTVTNAPQIIVYTFDIPPYTIHDQGDFSGAAYEIIREVFRRAKVPYTVKLLPFSRAYRTTQSSHNTFVFPLSKIAKRKNDFEWIGTILPSPMSVFALASRTDIRISTLNDMKNYRIGTVQNDARETYLLDHAFPLELLQRLSGSDPYERNIRKLAMGRIDLLPIPDHVLFYLCRKKGTDPKVFQRVFRFEELTAQGYSLAASPGTDASICERIRTELARFKETGEYTAILNKYGITDR